MSENTVATELVDLPSRGWFYSKEHPLSSGQIELFHMTAKHEDILTSRNLIVKGVAIDKLVEALVASKDVKVGDLFIGDKNAVIIAARILGYGRKYDVKIECPVCRIVNETSIDLQDLTDKDVPFLPEQQGKNEFPFTLPACGKKITFRLLTHKDDVDMRKELESLRKATKADVTNEVTTRMRYALLSVDGDRDRETIRKFIDVMPARDARALRQYAREIEPNVDLTFEFECDRCGNTDRLEVPIDHTFFWPE